MSLDVQHTRDLHSYRNDDRCDHPQNFHQLRSVFSLSFSLSQASSQTANRFSIRPLLDSKLVTISIAEAVTALNTRGEKQKSQSDAHFVNHSVIEIFS